MQTQPNPNFPSVPEMVGATNVPVFLGNSPTHLSFTTHPPTGPALLQAEAATRRVFLNIENVTASARAPSYQIYLNVPQGDEPHAHPELHAGDLPMFGLVESSRAGGPHPPNGLNYTLDITDVYTRLVAAQRWDSKNLHVVIVPGNWNGTAKVQVGRISLYLQ